MHIKDDALKVARYHWQQAADRFSAAYEALWGVIDTASRHGKIVYLVGDSIFQGWAFGCFERRIDADPGPLAHVDRTFNFVASSNNISCRCLFSGVSGIGQLLKLCSTVCIRGDAVALLDAGPRAEAPEAVEAYFVSILSTVRSFGLEAITFSNYTGPGAPPTCRYDIALGSSGTTANACIRTAAAKTGVRLLDLEDMGPRWEQLLDQVGCTLMLPDGVHFNPLGSVLIACKLLTAVCSGSDLSLDPLWEVLKQSWPSIHAAAGLPISLPQRLPEILEDIISSSK